MGIGDLDYEKAGVSIKAQNNVNAEVIRRLKLYGMRAEGLFGGAVDITPLRGLEKFLIGVASSSLQDNDDPKLAGTLTASKALSAVPAGATPLAALDYFASSGMDVGIVPDFVEGVALKSLDCKVHVIGGESAEMKGTYQDGKRDAFVHVLYLGEGAETVDIAGLIKGMERPLLGASTDGVGTKTKIRRNPEDIIFHGSNDIAAQGIRPVAFSLYVAGNVDDKELEEIVAQAHKSCERLGIKMLRVTKELKTDVYEKGEVDIAGTVVGVVDQKEMIRGDKVQEGDIIIGFQTECLMTNGYTLARRYRDELQKEKGHNPDAKDLPGLKGSSVNAELGKPHVPYFDILFGTDKAEGILSKYRGKVKATSHITGGGQADNIIRMVPDGLCVEVKRGALPLPPIVEYFRTNGASMSAMEEAFNMGVGFTVTVDKSIADEVVRYINKNFAGSLEGVPREARLIGVIKQAEKGEKFSLVGKYD